MRAVRKPGGELACRRGASGLLIAGAHTSVGCIDLPQMTTVCESMPAASPEPTAAAPTMRAVAADTSRATATPVLIERRAVRTRFCALDARNLHVLKRSFVRPSTRHLAALLLIQEFLDAGSKNTRLVKNR